jgi:hypothetical protein
VGDCDLIHYEDPIVTQCDCDLIHYEDPTVTQCDCDLIHYEDPTVIVKCRTSIKELFLYFNLVSKCRVGYIVFHVH